MPFTAGLRSMTMPRPISIWQYENTIGYFYEQVKLKWTLQIYHREFRGFKLGISASDRTFPWAQYGVCRWGRGCYVCFLGSAFYSIKICNLRLTREGNRFDQITLHHHENIPTKPTAPTEQYIFILWHLIWKLGIDHLDSKSVIHNSGDV